jgi:hypothetical protein
MIPKKKNKNTAYARRLPKRRLMGGKNEMKRVGE